MELLDTSGNTIPVEDVDAEFARAMSAPPKEESSKLDLPLKDKTEEKAGPAKKAASKPRTTTKAAASKTAATPASAVSSAELVSRRAEAGASTMHAAAMGATLAHNLTGVEAFQADAVVLATSADAFGVACAELASVSKGFAKFLDSGTSTVGAYLLFGATVTSIGLQIAANHGLIKAAPVEALNAVPNGN